MAPQTSPYIFGIVTLGILYATIQKLEWGVYLVFIELIIGSLGKMFVYDGVSIRMILWLVVLAVWGVHAIKEKQIAFFSSKLFKPFALFAGVIVWASLWGVVRGTSIGALFSDVNNYLYFALIFPIYYVFSKRQVDYIQSTIVGAVSWLTLKTIALFYIFSHELFTIQDTLYAWSRASRLAEITNVDPTLILSRIFMQSHIWLVFVFFVCIAVLYVAIQKKTQSLYTSVILATATLSAIIMSFSRSFWLAMAISSVCFVLLLIVVAKESLMNTLRFSAVMIGVGVLSVGFVVGVMKFPIPPSNADSSFIKDRASAFTGEAAVSSRYAQIRPLFEGISTHPVVGNGFGATVTYQSQDPRVLKNNPDGYYTTSAFELGWLEIWLKLGLVGVGAYLYLLFCIIRTGWKEIQHKNYLVLGGIVGLVALALTHGVSPYLNHPLGIGIIMLTASWFDTKTKND